MSETHDARTVSEALEPQPLARVGNKRGCEASTAQSNHRPQRSVMSSPTKILLALVLFGGLGTLGCEGRVNLQAGERDQITIPGGPGTEGSVDPSVDSDGDGVPDVEEPPPGTIVRPPDEEVDEDFCKFIDPGNSPLRRLTGDEYNNTVRDLFPGAQIPTQAFSPDERVSGFEANTVAGVTELMAEEYQRAAEAVSEAVVANLDQMLPADADEAAVRAMITDLVTRAYRRPPEAGEVDALYALFQTGETQIDRQTGVQMVIEAVLQSPFFMYRLELGEPGEEEVVSLSDYEVASRLSYFLWGTMPDETLLTAATAGELSTKEQVEAQARRMINDPKARIRINDVFAQWLQIDHLDGVDKADPEFTEEMKQSMIEETQAFIDHVVWEADGKISTLLLADYSFVDANVASVYGVEAGADGGLERVTLPPDRRGILSHPGVLAAYGEGQMPVHRGKFIRESFLCLTPPAPPNMIEPLETFEGESMRSKATKRMEAREQGCAGCHSQMDGIGLAFDMYDEMGRYRTQDEFGNALTDDGEILATGMTDGVVKGPAGLAQKLAESPQVQECVSKQFFRYAFSRMTGESDGCSLHMMNEALAQSGNDVKEMLVAITTTDAFLYRRNMSAGM